MKESSLNIWRNVAPAVRCRRGLPPFASPAGRPPWLSPDALCVGDRLVALRTVPVLIAGMRLTEDRHSPFAPLRSGGPQAATPATPRLLRVSRRPLFRARCASGQPSPVSCSRLRQTPPSPRCPSWPALSRNPGHPPLRARFPRRLASHFSPDGGVAAPGDLANQHESKPKPLKNSHISFEIMFMRLIRHILFLWSQYIQPGKALIHE